MRRIGIRELRQQASRHLREVQAGETIEVTDRGRPVALIVPVPHTTRLAELRATGRLSEPVGDALDLGPPLQPIAGIPLPSQVLAEMREDER